MLNEYQEKIALEILVSRMMLHTCKVQYIIWSNKYWLLTLATWILATRWGRVTSYLLWFTSVYRPNVAWSLLSGTMFCCLLFDDHSSVHSCVDKVFNAASPTATTAFPFNVFVSCSMCANLWVSASATTMTENEWEERECTGVLFIPEFIFGDHWWSAHSAMDTAWLPLSAGCV